MARIPGMGRRKIAMKKIEDKRACQVCFSKRRQGLFKKASELSILCGVQIILVVFSPAGRAYSFGSPSVESILNRFLEGNPSLTENVIGMHHSISDSDYEVRIRELKHECMDLEKKLEAQKKRKKEFEKALHSEESSKHHRWLENTNDLSLDELLEFGQALLELRKKLTDRIEQLLLQAPTEQECQVKDVTNVTKSPIAKE